MGLARFVCKIKITVFEPEGEKVHALLCFIPDLQTL